MRSINWDPERVAAFAPVASLDPFGPILNPAELLAGAYLYRYERNQQAALVAITREVAAAGIRVHVAGLVTDAPGQLQMRHLMQEIEAAAANLGADVLTLCTPHPAIIAGASRWGAHVSGAILAKYLKVH